MSNESELSNSNLDWVRSTMVDVFPSLTTPTHVGLPVQTTNKRESPETRAVNLSPCRRRHNINPSTRIVTEDEKNEIMGKLFNMMKISEMAKYDMNVLYRGLADFFPYLTGEDFETLITSYWCNGDHFAAIIRCRGVRLFDNEIFAMQISDRLLDRAMSCGTSICKLKAMLVQRRMDTFTQHPTGNKHKTLKRIRDSERSFFKRNCCLRYWNHEVLIASFSQLGWLTPDLAQIGLNKFLSYISDRLIGYGACAHTRHIPLSQQSKSIRQNEDDLNEPPEQSRRKRRRRRRSRRRAANNSVIPSAPSDMVVGFRHVLATYSDNANSTVVPIEDGDFEPLDSLQEISAASLSLRNLRKWMDLLELVTSRGAIMSYVRLSNGGLPVDGPHRLHVLRGSGDDILCLDCSCLMDAIAMGENTFAFLKTPIAKRNTWISSYNIRMPKDLWRVIDMFL